MADFTLLTSTVSIAVEAVKRNTSYEKARKQSNVVVKGFRLSTKCLSNKIPYPARASKKAKAEMNRIFIIMSGSGVG